MRIRVGINGSGRIGRYVLRCALDREEPGFEVVAVNNLAPVGYLPSTDVDVPVVTLGQVNRAFPTAADDPLTGILQCSSDPIGPCFVARTLPDR